MREDDLFDEGGTVHLIDHHPDVIAGEEEETGHDALVRQEIEVGDRGLKIGR